MNSQDRIVIESIIDLAKKGTEQVIKLEEYTPVMFRNIYNEAMIAKLTITMIEKGKVFKISI